MEYSGILVAARPEDLEQVRQSIDALPAFEVHQVNAEEGRLIVVQEAPDTESSKSGLRTMQSLPGVLFAELVYHLVDDPESNVVEES